MPDIAEHTPGTPAWVDLSSPDVEASKAFYSELFGWEASDIPNPGAGGYGMFRLRGRDVAGYGPLPTPDHPTSWSVYVISGDAAATAAAASEAGGRVVAGPMDVFDAGRLAAVVDPSGAHLGIWEPKDMKGAQVMFEPGSLSWCELMTSDMDSAKAFYSKVFGWDHETNNLGEQGFYTQWKLSGNNIAGAMQGPPQDPPIPPHWSAYFGVEDCSKAQAKAESLGAKAMVPATEYPGGSFAILMDPQGGAFGVVTPRR